MALTVSVALCTRNGASFVEEQVHSILAQSRAVTQLVVSDDASSDGTPELVEALLARHARGLAVTVMRNDAPLGVAGNFEQAIRACTGDLVALSDQDDIWMPDRLARLVPLFEDDDRVLLAHSDARLVDASGAPLGATLLRTLGISRRERLLLAAGRSFEAYLGRNVVTGATTVLRRSLADEALPVPAGWIHDEWLAVVAAVLGRVVLVEETLVDYRQHGANQIGATSLTLGGGLARLGEPREERNQRLVTRARSLVERLAGLERVDERLRELADGKLAHERLRLALPGSRARRVIPVLAELIGGGYRRYGRGLRDAARDLVQPT